MDSYPIKPSDWIYSSFSATEFDLCSSFVGCKHSNDADNLNSYAYALRKACMCIVYFVSSSMYFNLYPTSRYGPILANF